MLLKQASPALATTPLPRVSQSLAPVSEEDLRQWVERLAVPRHFDLEREENKNTALWIAAQFQGLGYAVELQGSWWNVVVLPKQLSVPVTLVCAHYDSVGGCPGADDNTSAVAAMLGCAKACAPLSPIWQSATTPSASPSASKPSHSTDPTSFRSKPSSA